MSLGDFENNKRKTVADNADLLRVVGELRCLPFLVFHMT